MEKYSTQATSRMLQFRWLDAQCIQIRLPNGKVILCDPFFPSATNPWEIEDKNAELYYLDKPFSVEDLKQVDYLILNHTHGDHILKLEEIFRMYHPIVIIHSAMAEGLARTHEIWLSSIYPVDLNGRYYFDGFTLDTFHGTHHPVRYSFREGMEMPGFVENRRADELNILGGLFNMNFIITTDSGFKIGFVGGDDDADCRIFEQNTPDILFRNKLHSSNSNYDVARDWADYLIRTHASLMVPMHHEKWLKTKPGYTTDIVNQMNQYLIEQHANARVLNAERTRWYRVNLSICAESEDDTIGTD